MRTRFFGAGLSLFLLAVLAMSGCGRSSAPSGGGGGGADAGDTPLEKEARATVLAEIDKHFIKTADGWNTAYNSGLLAPNYVRQYKNISVTSISGQSLSEVDKMNGFEWAGEVVFDKTPVREAGDIGYVLDGSVTGMMVDRPKGRWSQWIESEPDQIHVQKVNGKWQVRQNTELLNGTVPTAADWTKAGVKP